LEVLRKWWWCKKIVTDTFVAFARALSGTYYFLQNKAGIGATDAKLLKMLNATVGKLTMRTRSKKFSGFLRRK
jgi:hypothetical protein